MAPRRLLDAYSEFSLPPECKGSGDLSLARKLTSIRLPDTFPYVFDLPLMNLELGVNCLVQEVAPTAIDVSRNGVELFLLSGGQPKADSFPFHKLIQRQH